MKAKNKKNRRTSKVIFLPTWKYESIMRRLERQDKVITQLCRDVDDLNIAFRRFTKKII